MASDVQPVCGERKVDSASWEGEYDADNEHDDVGQRSYFFRSRLTSDVPEVERVVDEEKNQNQHLPAVTHKTYAQGGKLPGGGFWGGEVESDEDNPNATDERNIEEWGVDENAKRIRPDRGVVSVPVALEDDGLKEVTTCKTERRVHVLGAGVPRAHMVIPDGNVSLLTANDHTAGIYSTQNLYVKGRKGTIDENAHGEYEGDDVANADDHNLDTAIQTDAPM